MVMINSIFISMVKSSVIDNIFVVIKYEKRKEDRRSTTDYNKFKTFVFFIEELARILYDGDDLVYGDRRGY